MTDSDIEFETERLWAARWTMDDLEDAFEMYSNDEITRFIGGKSWADRAEGRKELAALIARCDALGPGLGAWKLIRRSDHTVVGTGLCKWLPGADRSQLTTDLEVGWHLKLTAQGNGYATEAGHALVSHGFARYDIDRIHAVVEPPNSASIAVARRLGMTPVGRSTEYYGGLEVEKFVLTREQWESADK